MGKNSEKDRAMASYMKEHGITRTTGRCPICNAIVTLKSMVAHIGFHN